MAYSVAERDCFLAWLGYFACVTIGGSLLGALIGGITGAILHVLDIPVGSRIYVIGALTLLATAILSYLLFRFFVRRLLRTSVYAAQTSAST